MSTATLMYMYGGFSPLPSIASYFKSKDALSSEKAVKMEAIDWIILGLQGLDTNKILKKHSFIKRNTKDKYWLDVVELDAYITKQRKLATKIILIFIVIFSFIIFFFLFRP